MNPTRKNKRKIRFAVNSRILTRRRIKGVLKSGGCWKKRQSCRGKK
jgi:hypothetical protein